MTRTIKYKGRPMTLVGRGLKTEKAAPDFRAISGDLKEVSLFDFKDKIKVITTFLSLDTSLCDLQVKEFNRQAVGFSTDVAVIAVSNDLPFAQKRFCQANSIGNLQVLSDYRFSSFGLNYGLLVKELRLLARSVLIVDKSNILRYAQVAEEMTSPLDYAAALANLQKIIANPGSTEKELLRPKCLPCEGGTPALSLEEVNTRLAALKDWQAVEGKKIVKEFKFKDFAEAKYFLDIVSALAEEQNHHPTLTLVYNKLKITLATHAAAGLTQNDFIMGHIIDELQD